MCIRDRSNQGDGLDADGWDSDYRLAGRRALREVIEQQMDDHISRYLEEMGRRGGARVDRRNGSFPRHLLTELGDIVALYSPYPVLQCRIDGTSLCTQGISGGSDEIASGDRIVSHMCSPSGEKKSCSHVIVKGCKSGACFSLDLRSAGVRQRRMTVQMFPCGIMPA